MSKRKRTYSSFDVPHDEEYPVSDRDGALICPECIGDDIFSEVVSGEEWSGNGRIDKSFTRFTCMNPSCGHFWETSA